MNGQGEIPTFGEVMGTQEVPSFDEIMGAPVSSLSQDAIVDKEDEPVAESDAEGFLSDAFKKGAEWVGRSGLMNSVFWKGFMTQGMIQSKMEGGGTAQEGMNLYREESQKQREKLAERDPTGLENTLAFVLSMSLDATAFAGYGTMGKGAAMGTLRGLSAAKNFMLSQGVKVGTVNKILPKAAKVAGEILKGSSTSSAALGGHTFSSGLLTALEEHDIDDIMYSEELRSSVVDPAIQSSKIGGVLGPLSVGTGVAAQLAQRGIKNNIGRFLATKGIQTAGFGGEVTTFAGVGALLNDEKLTWEGPGGFKETMIQLGALKLSHGGTAAGKKLLGKSFRQSKGFAEDKAGEGIYELHLTESEGKKLGLGDETTKEYLDRADKAGELGKIMEDPEVSMTTKAKLLWSARGVETKDLPPPAEVVIKGNEVELRDIEGGLIDTHTYADKGEALEESLSWQKIIERNDAARASAEFDAEQWASADRQMREAGIDKDALNESGVMLKHWGDLTSKEKETRDKVHDIIKEVDSEKEIREAKIEEAASKMAEKIDKKPLSKEETSKKIKFKPDLSVEGQQKAVTSNEVAIWEEFSKYGDTLGKAIKKIDDILSDKTTSASEKKKLSSLKEEIGDRITGPEDLNTSIQENIDFWKGLEQEPVRSAEKQKEIVKPSTQTSEEAWREVGREAVKKIKEAEADRMKEILTELKREDLTKEEKESLTDEMDELYYKEPDRGQKDIISEEQRAEADKRVEQAKEFLEEEAQDVGEYEGLSAKEKSGVMFAKALPSIMEKAFAEQKPFKEKFLKRKGLTIDEFNDLPTEKKQELQDEWAESSELKELNEKTSKEQPAEKPETLAEIQESTKKIIEEQEGPKPPPPELTTKDQVEVTLGGRTFKDNPIKVKPNGDIVIDHFGLKTIKKGDYEIVGKPKEEKIEVEDIKKERGPAESLMASFRGYTGYWDAPKETKGKLEKSRDENVKLFETERDEALKDAAPEDVKRLDAYYKKQIKNVKKLFSRDKSVAQGRGDEVRREMMRDFLQEKRKELAQIHGDKVPAMLQAVNKARTKAEIRNAFDYVQKVLDSKTAKDKLKELNSNLDYINKMTRDPSHKMFHDKKSQIARYKDNVAATKETIAKLNRLGEHLYARPNRGSKTDIPQASTVGGEKRTARENAIEEIEKLYKNNDNPTPEQADRAFELWFTDMGNMSSEEITLAATRIKEIVSLGKTKIQQERDAKIGDKKENRKELIGDLTGKEKETAPKVIGESPKKKRPNIIRDIVVGNRNWSSMLDRFSRYEFRGKNEGIGVYDSKLNRKYDKGLTQQAELETKTIKRVRSEEMVDSFIKAFRPTLDSKLKEGGRKETTALKKIAVRNEVELIDIPFRATTTKKTKAPDRIMRVTRDELSEMYQQMENPEMHRSLADGGFEIHRTGEIVKVKRPVTERGEDGKLRKTGEYENTDLGDQVYEAMDAKSELGKELKNEGLKELAENDFNTYEKWGDEVSPVYEEVFGPPMPRRKKYAPIVRSVDVKEGMTPEEMLDVQSAFAMGNNRHLYKMTNSTKPIVIMGSRKVMSSYMHKMSQFQGKARAVRDLSIWRDKDVQRAIKDEYGQNHVDWINQFLDQFAGQKIPQKTIRWMDNLRRNILVAGLGIKPMIYMKQLTSLPAYSLFLPMGRLTQGVAEYIGVVTGQNVDRTILNKLKNNDYLKNRYDKFTGGNMDRDISEVQQGAKEIENPGAVDWRKYKNMSMGLVKLGDRAPIMAGGYAVYKYHYKKNLSKGEAVANKIAADEFMHATKSAQQASDISDLSSYQRGDSWMRMATMYMTAPISYHRIASGGLRRMDGGIRGGNPKMVYEGARQFFIAHVVLPTIFQASANFFQFDTKEKRWDIYRAALLGNVNNLFALGDMIDHVADKFTGKPFDYQTFPAAAIPKGFGNAAKEFWDIIEKITDKDDITLDDILDVVNELESPMAHAFGVPIPGPRKIVEGITDVARGETEGLWDSFARIMGMSENALEAGRAEEAKEAKKKDGGVRQKPISQKPEQKEIRQKP